MCRRRSVKSLTPSTATEPTGGFGRRAQAQQRDATRRQTQRLGQPSRLVLSVQAVTHSMVFGGWGDVLVTADEERVTRIPRSRPAAGQAARHRSGDRLAVRAVRCCSRARR
jgi:hypothetical protein